MMKIYDFEQKVFIEGQTKGFQPTSIRCHLHAYTDEQVIEKEKHWTFDTFQDLWDVVAAGGILNAKNINNWFDRKIDLYLNAEHYIITERKYQKVILWYHCAYCPNVSLQTLLESIPADEMIEYLKTKGINM